MVGHEIWQETLKKVQNDKHTVQDLEYGEKPEKGEKCETHTVGPGIWRDTLKNMKNEKCTPQELDYGEKTEKSGKLVTGNV